MGLSAWKYIRNNKRTCLVLIIALGLTFAAMYLVNFLLMVTEVSFRPIYLEMPEKVVFADLTPETMGVDLSKVPDEEVNAVIAKAREETAEKLKALDGVENVWYTQVLNASYNAVFGMTGFSFPLLTPEQIPEYLEHMDAKLVEGKLPSEDGEILCDSTILKNQNLSVGDWFMENVYGKVFRISGVIESEIMACVGMPNGFNNTGWYFVVLVDEEHSDFRELAESVGIRLSVYDNVDDRISGQEAMKTEVKGVVDKVSSVILLVVMIFLAVSVLVAYISFMRNRVNEYCLYASIGFSRKEIYGMILREMGILFGTGILIGTLSSAIGMALMDLLLIHPQGLRSDWWDLGQMGAILTAFTAIIGVLQIPVLVTVHSIRTVDLMDD